MVARQRDVVPCDDALQEAPDRWDIEFAAHQRAQALEAENRFSRPHYIRKSRPPFKRMRGHSQGGTR